MLAAELVHPALVGKRPSQPTALLGQEKGIRERTAVVLHEHRARVIDSEQDGRAMLGAELQQDLKRAGRSAIEWEHEAAAVVARAIERGSPRVVGEEDRDPEPASAAHRAERPVVHRQTGQPEDQDRRLGGSAGDPASSSLSRPRHRPARDPNSILPRLPHGFPRDPASSSLPRPRHITARSDRRTCSRTQTPPSGLG